MNPKTFFLKHDQARKGVGEYALTAPEGWMVRFSEPTKKRIQEERYHAMVNDIAKQCDYHGRKLDAKSWKRLLVESMVHILREEAKAQDKPDPFPYRGAVLPSIDGMRIVQVEVLTRYFTVPQASAFIEYLFSYGAENDVVWTDPKPVESTAERQ